MKIAMATVGFSPMAPNAFDQSYALSQFFTVMAASTMPVMAPPPISPDEKSTPGPESLLVSAAPCVAATRRSTSQRSAPPMNIVADVEIGRYTPTATGSELMPKISIAIARNAPIRIRPHGSFCVRMPSTTSAMI